MFHHSPEFKKNLIFEGINNDYNNLQSPSFHQYIGTNDSWWTGLDLCWIKASFYMRNSKSRDIKF
jgi:hypothetical protein